MTCECEPCKCRKKINTSDSTRYDYKKTFPETTNQWFFQKPVPYEVGGPKVKRYPYVRERRIGGWSAN